MPQHIIAIQGGGARAAFAAAVLSRLAQTEPPADMLVGTSGGALCAAGLAHRGWVGLRDLWMGINFRSDVWRTRWDFWNLKSALYDDTPLRKIIEGVVASPALQPYTVCYSDLRTETPVYQSHNQVGIGDAIRASCAIPWLVDPVNGYMVDGGLFECTPLAYCALHLPPEGGDITAILNQNRDVTNPSWTGTNVVETLLRSMDAMLNQTYSADVKWCQTRPNIRLRVIEAPLTMQMSPLSFDHPSIVSAFNFGLTVKIPEFTA